MENAKKTIKIMLICILSIAIILSMSAISFVSATGTETATNNKASAVKTSGSYKVTIEKVGTATITVKYAGSKKLTWDLFHDKKTKWTVTSNNSNIKPVSSTVYTVNKNYYSGEMDDYVFLPVDLNVKIPAGYAYNGYDRNKNNLNGSAASSASAKDTNTFKTALSKYSDTVTTRKISTFMNASHAGVMTHKKYFFKNFEYYIKMKPFAYSVKFDANGGKGTMKDETGFVYDKKKALSENKFTRDGYTFKSWNTVKAGTGKTYKDKDSVQNLTGSKSTVTLYAQWQKNPDVYCNVNTSVANGTITKSTSVKQNGAVTIDYTPNEGYELEYVEISHVNLDNTSGDVVKYLAEDLADQTIQNGKEKISSTQYVNSGLGNNVNISVSYKEIPPEPELADVTVFEPVTVNATAEADGVTLSWTSDGTSIYHVMKENAGNWSEITSTDKGSYKDTDVTGGNSYSYKVIAESVVKEDVVNGKATAIEDVNDGNVDVIIPYKPETVKNLAVSVDNTGTMTATWDAVDDIDKYIVEVSENQNFASGVKKYDVTEGTSETIAGLKKATTNYVRVYAAKTINGNAFISDPSDVATGIWDQVPELANVTKGSIVTNTTGMNLTWGTVPYADGYEIEYAKDVLYLGSKVVTVKGGNVSSKSITLPDASQYYARIRAYMDFGNKRYVSSEWMNFTTAVKTVTAKVSFLENTSGNNLDVRKQAWNAFKKYSIGQGSCTDGTYIYMCFEYRNGDDVGNKDARIRIAKVDIATKKLVKYSGSLKLGHANDITYNSKEKTLVITGAKFSDPYLRVVDADTLKLKKTVKVNIKNGTSTLSAMNGISYNEADNTYTVRGRSYIKSNGNEVTDVTKSYVLNSSFELIKTVTIKRVYDTDTQGIETVGDNVLFAQSEGQTSDKNTIAIFDKAGKALQNIKLSVKGELESIFQIGKNLYGTLHKKGLEDGDYKTTFIFKILFS